MPTKSLIGLGGWIGVILVIGAYAALSFGLIAADLRFQIPSGFGALLVATNALHKHDRQAGTLNIIFALIASVAIVRLILAG